MKKKAVTISPSQLIGFLDQELNELPDNWTLDNKKNFVSVNFTLTKLRYVILFQAKKIARQSFFIGNCLKN